MHDYGRKRYIAAAVAIAALFMLLDFNARDKTNGRRSLFNGYDDTLTTIPTYTRNFGNVWEPIQPNDQPIFWYIGLTGGQAFTEIAARCLGLVQCSPRGDTNSNSIPAAPPVAVVTHQDDGGHYLNVNPATEAGLDLVASLGIVQNHNADLIVTPQITYASKLFDGTHKGRIFALFRNPVKRIVDQFYYRQAATWDPSFDPTLASMSIDEYAVSNLVDDNIIVRHLVGLSNGTDVTPDQLEIAKNVLREKVIVGIYEWFEASVVRFEHFFGWWDKYQVASNSDVNQCHSDVVDAASQKFATYPQIVNGGETWQTLSVRNWADVELYAYAKILFTEQNKLISDT